MKFQLLKFFKKKKFYFFARKLAKKINFFLKILIAGLSFLPLRSAAYNARPTDPTRPTQNFFIKIKKIYKFIKKNYSLRS
jgi:hypothetical protein